MNTSKKNFSILLLLVFISVSWASADWVQTNGPHSGYVQCFVVAGPNIFAGTRLGGVYGIFRSTNNGVSWTQTGLMNHEIWSLTVSGSILFAATYGDGIFLSTDDGDSWSLTNSGLTDVRALAISGTNIFAGTPDGGVYLSTNNGASWTQRGLHEWVNALAISGTTIFAATDTGGIYRSTNNGVTWTQSKRNRMAVVGLAVCDSSVFAAAYAQVYCTTDNGVSWTESQSGLPQAAYIGALAVCGLNIYAGTDEGVYVSTDNGTNWQEAGLKNEDVSALAVSGQCLLAGTVWSGVHLSLDEGASWTWNGFPISTVNALAVLDTILLAGTEEGVCLSRTSGTSWVQTYGPYPHGAGFTEVIAMAVSGADLIVAACTAQMYGCDFGIYLTTDCGMSWSAVGHPPPAGSKWSGPEFCLVASGTNLFAGARGVYLSTDEGTSWEAVNSGLPKAKGDTSQYEIITALASNGSILVAGMADGVVLSTNNGASWSQTGLHESVNALAFFGGNIYAGTDSTGVFRTTDNGATWSDVNVGLSKDPLDTSKYIPITSIISKGAIIFAGTPTDGIFLSTDNGSDWAPANNGLTNTKVKSLEVSGTNLFAGTFGGGVWRRPLSEMITSVHSELSEIPKEFRLLQNYPNPFNPSTTISYQIPTQSHVTLKIYDVLGREIITLVNKVEEPGFISVNLNAQRLASGVYYYRITARQTDGGQAGAPSPSSGQLFSGTKKLLLLR